MKQPNIEPARRNFALQIQMQVDIAFVVETYVAVMFHNARPPAVAELQRHFRELALQPIDWTTV